MSEVVLGRRNRRHAEERAKMLRLEAAEEAVHDLSARANKAIQFLEERRSRNHWRETVEHLFQGRT